MGRGYPPFFGVADQESAFVLSQKETAYNNNGDERSNEYKYLTENPIALSSWIFDFFEAFNLRILHTK